jgi:hypothetical protein
VSTQHQNKPKPNTCRIRFTYNAGASTTADGQLGAYLSSWATGMVDLGALGDHDSEAQDIND